MKNNASIIKKDNVSITVDGKARIVSRKYAESSGLIEALNNDDWTKAFELADRSTGLKAQSKGEFQVNNGVVTRNGLPIHNVVTDRILEFSERGIKFEPLVKFLDNVLENPSKRAIDEGYKFLEHKNLPVTEDGCFLAYKAVRADYRGKFTGKIDNSVGRVVEVKRNQVDDDFRHECSYGLHVGCLEYSGPNGWYFSQGNKTVIVKVNPRDIVAVPDDHNKNKMRVCRYEVIADFQGALAEPVYSASDNDFSGADDYSDEVECADCGWSGSYPELDDYNCPDCGSDYIESRT